MVLVAGIGVGLLVLIVIWTLTAVAVFVLAAIPKARYGIPAVLAVSVLISLVLILYPRESSSVNTAVQDVDEIFFGRLTLLVILGGFIVAGFAVVFKFHISEPITAGSKKARYVTA